MKRQVLVGLGCVTLLFSTVLPVAGCKDCNDRPQPSRSVGEPCEAPSECQSTLCYAQTCVDPTSDDDGDGLTNEVELNDGLGTDPSTSDTDGDGISDSLEIVDLDDPLDEDGDGIIDALESATEDADHDCLVDQKDASNTEALGDAKLLADLACCCYGSCMADWGIDVAPATCEQNEAGEMVITCPPDVQPDTDGDGVADPCDPCPDVPGTSCEWSPQLLFATNKATELESDAEAVSVQVRPLGLLHEDTDSVLVYASSGCTGEPVASADGGDWGGWRTIDLTLPNDADAVFTLSAHYAAADHTPLSSCSNDITYLVEAPDDPPDDPPVVTNTPPTGSVTISGLAAENETLTASHDLVDVDGLGDISYQWRRGGEAIAGATAVDYPPLTQADVGSTLTVTLSYTDGLGTAESVTSLPTDPVQNVNDAPTGWVVVSGIALEDETLTASHGLTDEDGLGDISTQWRRGGELITGATAEDYTLTQADVGATLTVTASYIDGYGAAESVTSEPTAEVQNVNDAPTGSVTISGLAVESGVGVDGTLTASHDLADADGLGLVGYQWRRQGEVIEGATAADYTAGQVDVGATLTVTASYIDGYGAAESVTSEPTDPVQNLGTEGSSLLTFHFPVARPSRSPNG